MKNYQVVLTVFENGETNPEVMDLVNVNDLTDRIMAAPDEFNVGEIVNENEFYLDEAMMVDEQYYGKGTFAFKK
jgi:hypothetical protein